MVEDTIVDTLVQAMAAMLGRLVYRADMVGLLLINRKTWTMFLSIVHSNYHDAMLNQNT